MTVNRLGILGGTFDPIHCGHLDVGRAAEETLALGEILVVPAHIPPHRAEPAASPYHRFAMVALAVVGRPRWRASDLELRWNVPSYTGATLARLHTAGYRPTDLFFVLGSDAFLDITLWKDYPAILDRAHFAVVSRPGLSAVDLPRRLPSLASRMCVSTDGGAAWLKPVIVLIDRPTADVSSTVVRRRLAEGQPLDGLVPSLVQEHIERHRLYRPPSQPFDALEAQVEPTADAAHDED